MISILARLFDAYSSSVLLNLGVDQCASLERAAGSSSESDDIIYEVSASSFIFVEVPEESPGGRMLSPDGIDGEANESSLFVLDLLSRP